MSGDERPPGAIPAIVDRFLDGQAAILLMVAALFVGIAAIIATPREEDPQIVVPLADVYVHFPGASAEELEKLVATPLERLLWQIDGVEYVYSVSRRDMAIVTVRFFVGEDRERSLVKLRNKVSSHIDEIPPGVAGWIVKPVEIDDTPIVTLTLYSRRYDDYVLRRVAEEVRARLDAIEDISRTRIVGGRRKEVRVDLLPEEMTAHNVSAVEIQRVVSAADVSLSAGGFSRDNKYFRVASGPFLETVGDVESLVVGIHDGRPVYLRDVSRVVMGPEEPRQYTRIGIGPAGGGNEEGGSYPAVTLALAKKRGVNAVAVSRAVVQEIERLKREVIPDEISVRVTRDYGLTANKKVGDLLSSLAFAMVTVVLALVFTLGWREGMIVALAVPISFSLALFVNYIFGYTINRVTLFALILTLGLVVDDPITNVDNIQRHILMGKRGPRQATLFAVDEVLPPVILSTLAVIVSFLPMFFITGMIGPYMQPMAVNVPLTVTFSTLASLTIVPWAAHLLLRNKAKSMGASGGAAAVSRTREIYRRLLEPFLGSRRMRWGLFGGIVLLLGACVLLVILELVPMKMLPFDNKNELQIVVDMPESSPLEATDAAVRRFEDYLHTVPEVVDFETYTGTFSPIDFNGLVRHYYLRTAPHLADIRINLASQERRQQQSHEIALRIRRDLERIALQTGAQIAIVESPPGPPVLSTLVAEIRGPADRSYGELIAAADPVVERLRAERGVVDVDTSAEESRQRVEFVLDKEKAGLHGIDTSVVVETLRMVLAGRHPATVHEPGERTPLMIHLRVPRALRSGIPELGRVTVKGSRGELIPLDELGVFRMVDEDQPIYHKNLERLVYVFGEMAGRAPAEAILRFGTYFEKNPLPDGIRAGWTGEGEWDITLRVFRDLGLAFAAALVGIYLLLVLQTSSFSMPLIIMTAIPLTAIGILPGFWILNMLLDRPIGGFGNPVFFTATAMIGMIALGGIVVRNSIVLIEFIEQSLGAGADLREAILDSGAVRMRPILLTALTTALGAWPIALDPIFSGLAWALIFGLFASTAFTLVVVPVMYFVVYEGGVVADGQE